MLNESRTATIFKSKLEFFRKRFDLKLDSQTLIAGLLYWDLKTEPDKQIRSEVVQDSCGEYRLKVWLVENPGVFKVLGLDGILGSADFSANYNSLEESFVRVAHSKFVCGAVRAMWMEKSLWIHDEVAKQIGIGLFERFGNFNQFALDICEMDACLAEKRKSILAGAL